MEEDSLVLLSQDEARFPMVPTMCRRLGVKGHRPAVGTWGCKDLLYVSASVNTVAGRLVSNTLESPARAKQVTGLSKTRRMQEAFADPLRNVAKTYPAAKHDRVVLIIDNAPWHRGKMPPGTGASRSTRRWPSTRTWSSSGCPATARN